MKVYIICEEYACPCEAFATEELAEAALKKDYNTMGTYEMYFIQEFEVQDVQRDKVL